MPAQRKHNAGCLRGKQACPAREAPSVTSGPHRTPLSGLRLCSHHRSCCDAPTKSSAEVSVAQCLRRPQKAQSWSNLQLAMNVHEAVGLAARCGSDACNHRTCDGRKSGSLWLHKPHEQHWHTPKARHLCNETISDARLANRMRHECQNDSLCLEEETWKSHGSQEHKEAGMEPSRVHAYATHAY